MCYNLRKYRFFLVFSRFFDFFFRRCAWDRDFRPRPLLRECHPLWAYLVRVIRHWDAT
jgi:hypothetical protein